MRQSIIVAGVSALTLGLVGFGVYQLVQGPGEVTDTADQDLNRTYAPPEITTVEETFDLLSVSGQAEPESIVAVSVDGERERSLAVEQSGLWVFEYTVAPAETLEMTIESYLGETLIRGDQTILRIPAPGAEDGIAQRPLILVTSPGGPSRVVQTPFGEPLRQGPLELTVIEYDSGGGTVFAGRGDPDSFITLERPNGVFGTVPVGPDGRWFSVVVEPEPLRLRDYIFSDSAGRSIQTTFQPLMPEQDLEYSPTHWQVRRELAAGGSQVAVVFATPVVPADDVEATEG